MIQSYSSDYGEQNDVNKLNTRLYHIEELIKEQESNIQETNVSLTAGLRKVSADFVALAKKVSHMEEKLLTDEENVCAIQNKKQTSYLKDLMTSLSLPGMKFIEGKNLSWIHSYFWILIHVVSLTISYFIVMEEYEKWTNSPVVKSVSNNLTYVTEIPFPAITVCFSGLVKRGYDYVASAEKCVDFKQGSFNTNCTYEEKASLAIGSLICPEAVSGLYMKPPWFMFQETEKGFIEGAEFSEYSKNILPGCEIKINRTISFNSFNSRLPHVNQLNSCESISTLKFVSRFGVCFTMNGFREDALFKKNAIFYSGKTSVYRDENASKDNEYVLLEEMVYYNGSVETEPAYITENHRFSYIFREPEAQCRSNKSKFSRAFFAIHHPFDVPFIFNKDYDLKFGEKKGIRIIPEMIITEKALENYKPSERGCFYSYERDLSMFKHYTEKNCKTECAANSSLQYCGCVPHYLPRHNISVKVCLSDCLQALKYDQKTCNCLPDCYFISYSYESNTPKVIDKQIGKINIKYRTSSFYPTIRVSLTNLEQFVAYSLGILGVFNGFSVMIIFEVFYYITLRIGDLIKFCLKGSPQRK